MPTIPTNSAIFVALLTLLVSCASGHQASQCSSSPAQQQKLRFVAQLSVNGCAIFVHDTGASDGPHLTVEPLMCVTQNFRDAPLRYDPVIRQIYKSFTVMLRDDALLAEVQYHLRGLSPKTVKFATVSDISVTTSISGSSGILQTLGFDWASDESTGILRVGCKNETDNQCALKLSTDILQSHIDVLISHVTMFIWIEMNGTNRFHSYLYGLAVQNRSFINPNIRHMRYSDFPTCNQLRYIRSIRLSNCTARVHQRLDKDGHFLVEPLLCHNISTTINESIMFDYNRNLYYLKLDIVLQDDVILNAVRRLLSDVSPRSVSFLQLWLAEKIVASAFCQRFLIGPLMVSEDWKLGQLRVYCRSEDECNGLRLSVIMNPSDIWRHIRWHTTFVLSEDSQICVSRAAKYSWPIQAIAQPQVLTVSKPSVKLDCPESAVSTPCKFLVMRDGRQFVVIQQRLRGSTSFQRGWSEYERGFGDETDFWIGLSTIHLLSIQGATLRLEMKQWRDGAELHAEYAGFKVQNASTNYVMTYRETIENRTNFIGDWVLQYNSGMKFSAIDKDNDGGSERHCSLQTGSGGWWFNSCSRINPNGIYSSVGYWTSMYWHTPSWDIISLSEVRLMLQIG